MNAFQLNYTITDPRLVEEEYPIHQTLINTGLTRETNNLLPALADEIASSIDAVWGTDTNTSEELCLIDTIPDVASQVVNRAFVGAPLCNNTALVSASPPCCYGALHAAGCADPNSLKKLATWRFFRELRPEVHRRLNAYPILQVRARVRRKRRRPSPMTSSSGLSTQPSKAAIPIC